MHPRLSPYLNKVGIMKTSRSRLLSQVCRAVLTSGAFVVSAAAFAQAVPGGGVVVAGQAQIIDAGAASMVIRQSSDKAIVEWDSFDLGAGSSISFENGAGATLNRVKGSTLSRIDGSLSASGTVYLLNPNGIVIGKNGAVNVGGGFVATTLDMDNSAFMSGAPLSLSGASQGVVVNLGRIGALGGDVVLAAHEVRNEGAIEARNGVAGLLSGSSVSLRDISLDNGRFAVSLGGSNGSVVNSGDIRAAMVELRANGGNIFALAGNNGNAISATGVATHDGKVFLVAEGGAAHAAGVIEAQNADGSGGFVETSGASADFSAATIHAGQWLIDPEDILIDSSAVGAINSALNLGTDVTLTTDAALSGNGDITVSAPISWSSSAKLSLSAYRDIHVYSTIAVDGGKLALTTGTGGSGDYDFGLNPSGFTGHITFSNNNIAADSLNINSQNYTLIFSMADLAGLSLLADINNQFTGNFAMVASLDASGTTYTRPVVDSLMWDSNFTGLGNTVSNLTINGSGGYIGLFNMTSGDQGGKSGWLRDLGIVGGSISGTGQNIGALVGRITHSSLKHVYSTANVSGSGAGADYVGGLSGNVGSADIYESFTTGSVTSASGQDVGGLVGWLSLFSNVTRSYATGAITGSLNVGGLVGRLRNGAAITQAYATGSVTGGTQVGGLVGYMDGTAANGSSVLEAYSTGLVSGGSSGGLIGVMDVDGGTVTNSYWDTQTSGLSASDGGTGKTTAQLQGTLPSGFDPSVWFTGSSMYPSFSPGNQKISGYVFDSASAPLAGATVTIYKSGSSLGSAASVGANGYYYITVGADTVLNDTKLGGLVIIPASSSTIADGLAFTDQPSLSSGDVVDFNIYVGQRRVTTSRATLSALNTDLTGTFGSDYVTALSDLSGSSLSIHATDSEVGFSLDAATTLSGDTSISGAGNISVGATVNGAYGLTLSSSAGGVVVNSAIGGTTSLASLSLSGHTGVSLNSAIITHAIGETSLSDGRVSITGPVTLTGNSSITSGGDITLSSTINGAKTLVLDAGSNAISLGGAIGGTTSLAGLTMKSGAMALGQSIDSTGAVLIQTLGDLTIDEGTTITSAASGTAITLAANGSFINNGNASILQTENGRWLIYSQAQDDATALPTGNVAGGLSAKNYYGDPFNFNTGAFASTPGSGNRFVYGYQPSLTITADTKSVTYNASNQTDSYSVSGLLEGDALSDAISGTPGGLQTSTPTAGEYDLTPTLGTLSSDLNYAFEFETGTLTISPKTLTASLVGSIGKVYDGTAFALLSSSNYALSGAILGDDVGLLMLTPATYNNENAGTGKRVTTTMALKGADSANYVLAVNTIYADIGTITRKPLTVQLAGPITKIYDGTRTATITNTNLALNGVIAGDAVVLIKPSTGTYDTKSAGANKQITVTGLSLSGTDAINYSIPNSVIGAVGVISQKVLTASLIGSVSKIYDGSIIAPITAANLKLTGAISGDAVGIGLNGSATYSDKNAGISKVVVAPLVLTGADRTNYRLALPSVSATIGKISARPLTLSFGGTVFLTGATVSSIKLDQANISAFGIVPGDAIRVVAVTQSGVRNAVNGSTITVQVPSSNVQITGADAKNYTVSGTSTGRIRIVY